MKDLRDIVAGFAGRSVLVVGDVMLDEYIWGEVRRVSPEAPVPIVDVCRRSYAPGGAANAAANVISLGGRVRLGGAVGRDQQAESLCEALLQAGVNPEGLVVDDQRPTTTKTRVIAHSLQLLRLDLEQRLPLRAPLEDALCRWFERHLADADACVLSDYAKGAVSPRLAKRFIQLAREAGKPAIVDPKGDDYARYRGATVVTPNVSEAERAVKWQIEDQANVLEIGRQLSAILEGSALLITRGPQGMSLFLHGVEALYLPAAARIVLDVVGAGDTVVSALAMALAAGATVEQAAHLANLAAGIAVGKVGRATVTRDELLEAIE
jgi:rfaE bifunctional protein kinase chain/domain